MKTSRYRTWGEFERDELAKSPYDFEPILYEELDWPEYDDDDEEVQELPF